MQREILNLPRQVKELSLVFLLLPWNCWGGGEGGGRRRKKRNSFGFPPATFYKDNPLLKQNAEMHFPIGLKLIWDIHSLVALFSWAPSSSYQFHNKLRLEQRARARYYTKNQVSYCITLSAEVICWHLPLTYWGQWNHSRFIPENISLTVANHV